MAPFLASLVFAGAMPWVHAAESATTSASAAAPAFSTEELDQMLAPIALYPDSLLAQVLMASTYPADVAEAAKWVKANPKQEGDAAVKAVQSKNWDPSVQSLAAFPQVLTMMGEKPEHVQRLGDAFLADPARVMDRVQFMRKKAQEAGNLKSTEQQNVSTPQTDSGQTAIIIEPAQPEKVYVPVYQPTVVYGSWWYPGYPPYYWAPPPYYYPGYYPGAAFVGGVLWGAAIVGISNGLWGGCNWGHGDVDINVNRYNNINVNNKINADGKQNWKHNAENRKGVPYRDEKTRQQHDRKAPGAENRSDYRGRDAQRDASRDKAQATMKDRGLDPAAGRDQLRNDPQTRDRANQATKNLDGSQFDRGQADRGQMDRSQDRAKAQNMERSQANRSQSSGSSWGSDNAFKGAGNASQSRDQYNRGSSSRQSAGSYGGSNRSMSSGARSGGGARAGGGGGRRR
jgi:uncharacterized membrane protein YgcG